jgi:hypothetical protein
MIAPEIEHFTASARAYCDFMESAHQYALADRLVMFASLLADLYATALRLPDAPRSDREAPAVPDGIPQWAGLGDLTLYWEVSDPYEWEAPVCGSLSDDLRDVYQDLKRGLLILERGDAISLDDAVWEWRSHFVAHWGEHAVDALRALHRAMRREADGQ